MRAYFRGCSNIKNPVDVNGKCIKIGDKLSWDYHDEHTKKEDISDWMRGPIFIVEAHTSGGLCANGIEKDLYLHDFRFKYCEIT